MSFFIVDLCCCCCHCYIVIIEAGAAAVKRLMHYANAEIASAEKNGKRKKTSTKRI